MNATNQAIQTLTKTALDLQIQSEVTSILDSIITDIDTAHSLEEQINNDRLVGELKRRCGVAEEALREYKALEKVRMEERQVMGELFLKDLMILEDKMEGLEHGGGVAVVGNGFGHAVREDQSAVDSSHAQPEEDEHDANAVQEENAMDPSSQGIDTKYANGGDPSASKESLAMLKNDIPSGQQGPSINDGPDVAAGKMSMEETPTTNVEPQTPVHVPEQPPLPRNTRRIQPLATLQSLKPQLLMSVFEYMDALDIVNMAQTNVRLYSKVDSIFGLGGTIVAGSRGTNDDDYDDYENGGMENSAAVVVIEDDIEQEEEEGAIMPTDQNADVDVDASVPTVKNLDSGSDHRATIVSIPTKATKVTIPDKITSQPANIKPAADIKISPSAEASTAKAAAAAPKVEPPPDSKPKKSTTALKRSTTGFQMSPAVAQSLASKLLPAELSAIITMRDQLRKKEDELQTALEDVDDLTAQLGGTISVKDVLTEKVKELQNTLVSDREISAKITRQTSSDQEVIAFLDERVQELEKAVDNYSNERTKANKSIDKVKDASERQVAVLTDMLTYEREQKSDQEKEWKSTKKVLVKEVKHCRAEIMALEAERDGFRQENQRLKEALLSLGGGSGLSKTVRSFDTAIA